MVSAYHGSDTLLPYSLRPAGAETGLREWRLSLLFLLIGWYRCRPLRYKVPGDPSRGRGYSPRMEHAIDYKSVLDCGIHQDWTPDS